MDNKKILIEACVYKVNHMQYRLDRLKDALSQIEGCGFNSPPQNWERFMRDVAKQVLADDSYMERTGKTPAISILD